MRVDVHGDADGTVSEVAADRLYIRAGLPVVGGHEVMNLSSGERRTSSACS